MIDERLLFASRTNSAAERADEEVRSIRVDEHTGRATGQPQLVTGGAGSIGGISVTSDGKRLVYGDRTPRTRREPPRAPNGRNWRGKLLSSAVISVPVGGRRYRPFPRREATSACLLDQDPTNG